MPGSPAIDLFKDQLNQLLHTMASDRGLLGQNGEPSPDLALPHWYLETFLGYTEANSPDEVTEGFSDLAIDAIVISDDEDLVHFYQFKNPVNKNKGIDGGDVDKLISGFELILQGKHAKNANQRLRLKIEEIRQKPRVGYRIHFVSTGGGLPGDGKEKLKALTERWATRGTSPLQFDKTDIADLQVAYYNKILPTLDKTVVLKPPKEPYMVQIGSHRSFVFHIGGAALAKLYEDHGEQILQQNIRTSEGDTETNRAIARTAKSKDSEDFYYFNNGVTILSDTCVFDQFQGSLSMTRPQIVNGGQTLRILAQAQSDGRLKADVFVTVRAITSDNDRAFAGNVAVNLNNQTVVKPSFLRSNHPEIIQLAGTLATKGYYLERREGELQSMQAAEIAAVELSINNKVKDHTILLNAACQSFIAFFDNNIDIAKKNPKQIFIAAAAGGYFEQFIGSGLTAEKFVFTWQLYRKAIELKRNIAKISRTKSADSSGYRDLFPKYDKLVAQGLKEEELEAAAPQSSLFLIALLGRIYNQNPDDMLLAHKDAVIGELGTLLLRLVKSIGASRPGAWPTMLKSQSFFETTVKKLKLRPKKLK